MYYLHDLIPEPEEPDSSDNDDDNNSKYTTSTDPSIEPLSDHDRDSRNELLSASNITMNSNDSDH